MNASVPLEEPEDVLRHALTAWPRMPLVSALGPQTLVVLELLHRMGHRPSVWLLDTGLLPAETLALRAAIEERYQLVIRAITSRLTVQEQEAVHGPQLWRRDPEACCRLRKQLPLAEALRGQDAWISGLRRDQSAARAGVEPIAWDHAHGLVKVSPLWRWSQDRTLAFLREAGLPYNPLLDRGWRSVGCAPCSGPTAGGERDGRWSGTGRTECGIHRGTVRVGAAPRLLSTPTWEADASPEEP